MPTDVDQHCSTDVTRLNINYQFQCVSVLENNHLTNIVIDCSLFTYWVLFSISFLYILWLYLAVCKPYDVGIRLGFV